MEKRIKELENKVEKMRHNHIEDFRIFMNAVRHLRITPEEFVGFALDFKGANEYFEKVNKILEENRTKK